MHIHLQSIDCTLSLFLLLLLLLYCIPHYFWIRVHELNLSILLQQGWMMIICSCLLTYLYQFMLPFFLGSPKYRFSIAVFFSVFILCCCSQIIPNVPIFHSSNNFFFSSSYSEFHVFFISYRFRGNDHISKSTSKSLIKKI